MKRILLIAYAYPPYPIVGAIRAQRLADTFTGAGHQVYVLTARLPQERDRIRSTGGSLTVETVPTWPHPKDLYRWAKRRVANDGTGQGERAPRFVEEEQWQPPAHVPRWKRYILLRARIPGRPAPPADEPFRVLYVGGIGAGRDPLPFLDAVSSLVRTSQGPDISLRVDFVGNCRYYAGVDLQQRSRELGIGDVVSFTSRVPHEEARRLQRQADLLLLLAQRQPAQVPNKLYEYLGANRPILALADHDGESARMIRRVGGHYLVTERDGWNVEPVLREALEAYIEGRRFKEPGPDLEVLEEWRTERQMRHLLEEIGLS